MRQSGVMEWTDRIDWDPEIIGGKPKVKGTRLAVELILELLAAGVTEQQLFQDYYPILTHEDVLACLGYASHLAHEVEYYSIPADAPSRR
jgi:uncharacterized protein (DUF433 family)